MVSRHIGEDWRRLSKEFSVKTLWKQLYLLGRSNERCMQEVFGELNYRVTLDQLKQALEKINRQDIVHLIEKETVITFGE